MCGETRNPEASGAGRITCKANDTYLREWYVEPDVCLSLGIFFPSGFITRPHGCIQTRIQEWISYKASLPWGIALGRACTCVPWKTKL